MRVQLVWSDWRWIKVGASRERLNNLGKMRRCLGSEFFEITAPPLLQVTIEYLFRLGLAVNQWHVSQDHEHSQSQLTTQGSWAVNFGCEPPFTWANLMWCKIIILPWGPGRNWEKQNNNNNNTFFSWFHIACPWWHYSHGGLCSWA